jgi:hypothetical protein
LQGGVGFGAFNKNNMNKHQRCTHLTCRLRVPLIIIASVSIITGIGVAVLVVLYGVTSLIVK